MNRAEHKLALLRTDLQKSLAASAIDPQELSVFQRILLTTDGMVTEMLEAYLQEHIVVSKLAQGMLDQGPLDQGQAPLDQLDQGQAQADQGPLDQGPLDQGPLDQGQAQADQGQADHLIKELELNEGDAVLHRAILLTGEISRRHHLYAESAIAVDRLIKPIRDGLLQSRKPIGMLILENRLETFREILVCVEEPAGALAAHFRIEPDELLLSRTYRVFAHGQAIMLITEKFPETFFVD